MEKAINAYINGKPGIMELGLQDSAIVFKEDGKLELHLAKPEDADNPEAITPQSAIAVLKVIVALENENIRRMIDEEFDNVINNTREDREVEEFVNEETSEGC